MKINSVTLNGFRSHIKRKFSFSPGITVVVGDNAKGKTNLLEAVFVLSTGKSFRADHDRDMINFEKEMVRIEAVVNRERVDGEKEKTEENIELNLIITCGMVMNIPTPLKKYEINGVGKSGINFVGILKTVLFWPEDLELVTDSPGRRRKYLDFILTQVDREYRRNLLSYEKAVRQRNRVLEAIRDEGAHPTQLIFWDQLIIKAGQYLSHKREEFINFINQTKSQKYHGEIPEFQLEYDKSEISQARLLQYKEEEVASGNTLVGPHRDDFQFLKEERKNLSQFGSRGEQRLGILWLKIGELSYIETVSSQKPVLLLDDIFSELDHEHRKLIFDMIGTHQTIMTTTDLHHIDKKILEDVELIKLP